jgi:hypothetical protein
MQISKEPDVLFPIVIAFEAIILLSIGDVFGTKNSAIVLFWFCITQIMLLTFWGGLIIRFLKNKLHKTFWLPVIAALLFYNAMLLLRI